jgi:putative transposase
MIRAVLDELGSMRERGVKMLGYVVMPERVHLVLLPPDTTKLGIEIGRLKSLSARKILPILKGDSERKLEKLVVERDHEARTVFWQRRCYDHNCRTAPKAKEKIEYCHKNPVNRGLVKDPADWPWSSYRCYMGLPGVELEIDGIEL